MGTPLLPYRHNMDCSQELTLARTGYLCRLLPARLTSHSPGGSKTELTHLVIHASCWRCTSVSCCCCCCCCHLGPLHPIMLRCWCAPLRCPLFIIAMRCRLLVGSMSWVWRCLVSSASSGSPVSTVVVGIQVRPFPLAMTPCGAEVNMADQDVW